MQKMKFHLVGETIPNPTEIGLWKAFSEGHPEHGLKWETYHTFIISADTFGKAVEVIRDKLRNDVDHSGYHWSIELIGIDIMDERKDPIISSSHKAG